jgi:DNA-damage-inducible protein J
MTVRIANDRALHFEPLIPNAETIEAMRAVRRRDVTTAHSIPALFAPECGRLIFD